MLNKDYRAKLFSGNNISILSHFLVICLFGIALFTSPSLFGQKNDPFYTDFFKEAEKSFLDGNYRKALRGLEIAVFGMNKENELLAKAYVYMSLSHYYLENKENSEKYLRQAAILINENGIERLELKPANSVMSDLRNLLNHFNLDVPFIQVESQNAPENVAPFENIIKNPEEKEELVSIVIRIPENSETPVRSPENEAKRISFKGHEKNIQADIKNEALDNELLKVLLKISGDNGDKGDNDKKGSNGDNDDNLQGNKKLQEQKSEEARKDLRKQFLTEIVIQKTPDSLEIELHFEPYTSHLVFHLQSPKRIVINLRNLMNIDANSFTDINDFGIKAIRAFMFKTDIVRVVLDVAEQFPSYRVQKIDNGLKVTIPKRS